MSHDHPLIGFHVSYGQWDSSVNGRRSDPWYSWFRRGGWLMATWNANTGEMIFYDRNENPVDEDTDYNDEDDEDDG